MPKIDKGLTEAEIADKNEQYRKFAASKNANNRSNLDFQIETKTGDGGWTFRMLSLSPAYLDSVGRCWVEGKFCDEYRVNLRE